MIARVGRPLLISLAALAPLLLSALSRADGDDVGRAAPALIVRQLDGQELDLAALRGQVVVLNFWATWCPPCRAEMPMLDAFYRQHQSEGMLLVGLSADDQRDRKKVVKAMQGLTYPAALLKDATANGFGAPRALPITYVIGADGVIRARLLPQRRALTEQDLATAVRPLLAQDGVSVPH
jgi:thiol-disulfide isomerase/thioredoxin